MKNKFDQVYSEIKKLIFEQQSSDQDASGFEEVWEGSTRTMNVGRWNKDKMLKICMRSDHSATYLALVDVLTGKPIKGSENTYGDPWVQSDFNAFVHAAEKLPGGRYDEASKTIEDAGFTKVDDRKWVNDEKNLTIMLLPRERSCNWLLVTDPASIKYANCYNSLDQVLSAAKM